MTRTRSRVRRRLIAAVICAAVLLSPIAAAVVISLQNDAAAAAVKDQLVAMDLPPESAFVASYARAGKLVGNGNGMQYLGAILIRSDLTTAELDAHYAAQADALDQRRTSEYPVSVDVLPTGSAELDEIRGISGLLADAGGPDEYVVYMWGAAPSPLHADWDLRGH